MNALACLGITALCLLLGRAVRPLVTGPGEQTLPLRLVFYALAGAGLLYSWLFVLDAMGVRWTRLTALALPALVACVVAWFQRRPTGQRARHDHPSLPLGWGDALALLALSTLVYLLREPCLVMADFLFHWGFKAQHFWRVGGIDTAFLAEPWNFHRHPDYPQLVPSVFAATALLRGIFAEPAMFLFGALLVAGVAAAVRDGFARAQVDHHLAYGGLALITVVLSIATMGLRQGGSPDMLMALLVTLGAVQFRLPADAPGRDGQIGLLAAIAASAKMEGVVFAALLLGGHLWRRWRADGFPSWRTGRDLFVLPLLVAAPWAWTVFHHGLMTNDRAGRLRFDHTTEIIRELVKAVSHPGLHGAGWVVVALPVLVFVRATRAPALLLCSQAAFYGWVYWTTNSDPGYLVSTSAVRLVLHLLAGTLFLTVVALDCGCRPARDAGSIAP